MSLTVSSIQADVSTDVRQVLQATDSKLISWIDRIHKDCLHSSVYSHLNLNTFVLPVNVGVSGYTLVPPSPLRRVISIYDLSRDRLLFPLERASSPVSQVEKQEPGPGQQGALAYKQGQQGPVAFPALTLQTSQPEYYRHVGTSVFFYPTPQQPISLQVTYEAQVVTLVNPTDVLLIPEDGRDMVVAGVNWLANIFLKRTEEGQAWLQTFQQLKLGITLT